MIQGSAAIQTLLPGLLYILYCIFCCKSAEDYEKLIGSRQPNGSKQYKGDVFDNIVYEQYWKILFKNYYHIDIFDNLEMSYFDLCDVPVAFAMKTLNFSVIILCYFYCD